MLYTVIDAFCILLNVYSVFLLVSVIFSWIPNVYDYKIPRIIGTIGHWYLRPFRGKLVFGVLDFTPLIGFFIFDGVITLLQNVLMLL